MWLRVVAWWARRHERETTVRSWRSATAIVVAAEHVSERAVFPFPGCLAMFASSCATISAAVGGGVVVVIVVLVHFGDEVPEVVEVGHDVE